MRSRRGSWVERRWGKRLLVALHVCAGVSGVAGGLALALALAPDGSVLHAPLSMLASSPFDDFFVPGLTLLLAVGVFNLACAAWQLRPVRFGDLASFLAGCTLVGWILVEVAMLRSVHALHAIYLANGLAIAGVVLARRPAFLRTFFARWVAACAVAELAGIGVAGGLAVVVASGGGATTLAGKIGTLSAMALAGAVEGTALGYLQWRLLRERLPRLTAFEWTGMTAALAIVGWVAGMAGPVLTATHEAPVSTGPSLGMVALLAAGVGAGAGLVFGVGQWLVLRRHAEGSRRWIAANVLAWAPAMAAIFVGAALPAEGWWPFAIVLSGAIGGLAGGLALGLVTGVVARTLEPWVDERRVSMAGKVCVVTGASSGVGFEVALGLARMGATLVLLTRTASKGRSTRRRIFRAAPRAEVHAIACNLESPMAVRLAARELRGRFHRIDALMCCAGATFFVRQMSRYGVERTLAADALGHFLLTNLLRDRLEAANGRVVNLAGIDARKGRVDLADLSFGTRAYDWRSAKEQAQRAKVLLTAELARRAPGLTAVAVHPGAVFSAADIHKPLRQRLLAHSVLRPRFMRAELAAQPVLRLAALPSPREVSGRFFDRFALQPDAPREAECAALWQRCEELTGLAPPAHAPTGPGVEAAAAHSGTAATH